MPKDHQHAAIMLVCRGNSKDGPACHPDGQCSAGRFTDIFGYDTLKEKTDYKMIAGRLVK